LFAEHRVSPVSSSPLVPVPDQVGDKLQRGPRGRELRRLLPLDSRVRGNERNML
jgi:hypothetical protein